MNAAEQLSEKLRVRVSPTLKARLDERAELERRSPAAIVRRALERELERAGGEPAGRS